MDIFEYMRNSNMEKDSPLASRLRPTTLEEVAGQRHIIDVSEVEEVIFLTDHPFNDIGFIIGEEFGGRWGFYVGSKKEFKAEFKKFRSLIGQNKKLSLN